MSSEYDGKKITPRNEDYAVWYQDIIEAADLAEHAPVKGCMIIKPYGYAIWEIVQKTLDERFKKTGVENAYFPLLIPERLLKREENHIEGFAPEVAVVTHAGGKELEEPLVIRPTSETIMYEVFSKWVRSHRDLPLLINQWANVVRWEMRTRLFLRTTEFLWQEGHTVHVTEDEADTRARQMLNIYKEFSEQYMAIPVIPGIKSDSEKFAGAQQTYTCEAMMQDGKALQLATSHNLGQNFSKAFDITFLDEKSERQFGWQTSWGLSTRVIGGLIMTHSDDKGLVLPPKMASIQVVIVPITPKEWDKQLVDEEVLSLSEKLIAQGVRVRVDNRDLRPGEKYFEWEKKGVPLRIEIGPKDIAANVCQVIRRDTGEKKALSLDNATDVIAGLLNTIQSDMLKKAQLFQDAHLKTVDDWQVFKTEIEAGNFVLAHFDGDAKTEAEIKEEIGATIRCIPFSSKEEDGVCVKSGKPSKKRVIFARAY